MTSSNLEIQVPRVRSVVFTSTTLTFDLEDGRSVSAPLDWFPRLLHGTPDERAHWRLIGDGYGVHWPELDEDLSVEGMLAGRRSMESQRSFRRWLDRRSMHAEQS